MCDENVSWCGVVTIDLQCQLQAGGDKLKIVENVQENKIVSLLKAVGY